MGMRGCSGSRATQTGSPRTLVLGSVHPPMQPLGPDDSRLLVAVSRGEFALNGFRNRDLRPLLYGAGEATRSEWKRQGTRTTRQIRMLRAHGLIRKVPKTHRYILTSKGRLAINALLAAQQASPQQLAQLAA